MASPSGSSSSGRWCWNARSWRWMHHALPKSR